MNHTWKYVYVDTIKVQTVYDDVLEKDVPIITATNRHLFFDCPIIYRSDDGVCYIYSNKEIPELELVATDLSMADNNIAIEDLKRLEEGE
ncbi:MAG: hypothetical protein ACTSX2_00065 [Candidatus Thorarchaeota archaeon]